MDSLTALAVFLTDSYKMSHYDFTVPGTEVIYSNFTPRFTKYMKKLYPGFDDNIVWFGLQGAIKDILIKTWTDTFFALPKDQVIDQMKRILTPYINMTDFSHFEKLHDLGYLPIEIKSLPEGALVKPNVPCFTIKNTHPDFQWLPNYLETILSAQIWKPMTVATVGRVFRKLVNERALKTTGSLEGTDFQLHDFSFRGQSGYQSSAANGAGFLLSSWGTDNIPALLSLEQNYGASVDKEPVGFSVPAGEHSVTTLGINVCNPSDNFIGEVAYVDYVLDKFKTGIVSYVADSYDYWRFVTDILPLHKGKIMQRDGKFVVRGDSGDPVDIICGVIIDKTFDSPENTAEDLPQLIRDWAMDHEILNVVDTAKEFITKLGDNYFKVNIHAKIDVVYGPQSDTRYHFVSDVEAIVWPYELTAEDKGTVEVLYELFGGTVNQAGYKVLDSHIGMIYGDGITYQRLTEIFDRLELKGFASTNIVLGVGSFALNMVSRDHLGTAVKATNAIVNGNQVPVYKDPKTDSSKKSAKGLLKVVLEDNVYKLVDNVTEAEEAQGELKTVYKNGQLVVDHTLSQIRDRLWSN
jgi:nicotinamide phosphoribosyltransferase